MNKILNWWRNDIWQHRALLIDVAIVSMLGGAIGGVMVILWLWIIVK